MGGRTTQRMNRSLDEKMHIEGEGWAIGRGAGGVAPLQEGPGLCRSPGDAQGFIRGHSWTREGGAAPGLSAQILPSWCHNESHTHSILEIAECEVAWATSQWEPAPGHSWQSPSCMVSSTGMCLDRRTTYHIFCWGLAR